MSIALARSQGDKPPPTCENPLTSATRYYPSTYYVLIEMGRRGDNRYHYGAPSVCWHGRPTTQTGPVISPWHGNAPRCNGPCDAECGRRVEIPIF